MTTHSSSAPARQATPHANRTIRTATIMNALTQRTQSVLNDPSIDAETRAILRYAMETRDPWLAKMVRRAEAGERVIKGLNASQTSNAQTSNGGQGPESSNDELSGNKIELLVDRICRAGDEPETKSAALLVLMSMIEKSTEPTAVANTAKHIAFAHCGELTFDDMVDAQTATFEAELFAGNTPVS